MPIFEFQKSDGTTIQIDAPDQNSAVSAFNRVSQPAPAAQPAGQNTAPTPGAFASAVLGLGDIPVIGPAINEVSQDIAAGIGTLMGKAGIGPERTFAEERALDKQIKANAEAAHPYATAAGGALGTGALMAPIAMSGPIGATAMGVGKAPFLARLLASSATNAGLAGADTLVKGGSLKDAETNAGVSGALNAGIMPIASIVGGLARIGGSAFKPLLNMIRSPETQATKDIGTNYLRDVRNGTATAPEVLKEAEANGQPLMNTDVGGGNIRSLGRAATNISPDALDVLTAPTNARFHSQGIRLTSFIDDMMGGKPSASFTQDELDAASRAANAPAYKRAYAEGDRPIVISENLYSSPAVQDALKLAYRNWKTYAVADGYGGFNPPVRINPRTQLLEFNTRGKGVLGFPNLQFWDYTTRALKGMIDNAPSDMKGPLIRIRQQMLDELDQQVPSYASARQGAANFFKADNALEAGQNFVGQTFDIDGTRKALSKMTDQERNLFGIGFASRLRELVQNATSHQNLVVKQIFDSPAGAEKVRLALGDDNAKKLEGYLRGEALMNTWKEALGNSTTARQLLQQSAVLGTVGAGIGLYQGRSSPYEAAGYGFGGAASGIALAVGLRQLGFESAQKVATEIGKQLATYDPAKLQLLAKQAERSENVMNGLKALSDFTARFGVPQEFTQAQQKVRDEQRR